MDRSLRSFLAGVAAGIIITIILSLNIENWYEDPTALVLGITSAASKIWLVIYYVQLLPALVISGLEPLQQKFKIKRLVPYSFGLGQATIMIGVAFVSYTIDLLT